MDLLNQFHVSFSGLRYVSTHVEQASPWKHKLQRLCLSGYTMIVIRSEGRPILFIYLNLKKKKKSKTKKKKTAAEEEAWKHNSGS